MTEKSSYGFRMFVYLIESPSEWDLYMGRSEGELVKQALGLKGILCVQRLVCSQATLAHAVTHGLPEVINATERPPIIHISAHGDEHGIQLTSGEVVPWDDFRKWLVPLNHALEGHLLLCMSSCSGFAACTMALAVDESPDPFFGVVGNTGKPTWPEAAIAYAAFYHHLSEGALVPDAVQAMKAASGNDDWSCVLASAVRDAFGKYLIRADGDAIGQQLEREVEQVEVPVDAKAGPRSSGV